jgi:adenosylhomocysteine nucleosidase
VTAVISTGWVGALTGEFVPGRVYAVAGVIDAKTGERFEAGEAVLANGGLPPAHTSWRSAADGREKGGTPQGLKPQDSFRAASGPAEAGPLLQSAAAATFSGSSEGVPLQSAAAAEMATAVDSASSAELTAPKPWVVTSNKVANTEEKRRLAGSYPAGLVDMEAAAVARLAEMRRIPFLCIKGVSDGQAARLPDFNRFLTPEGHFQLARFIFFALIRPWYWPELMRMSENSSKASQALRDSLLENLRRTGAN